MEEKDGKAKAPAEFPAVRTWWMEKKDGLHDKTRHS